MAEYIERQELLKDITESVVFTVRGESSSLEIRGANKIIDRIKSAPTADVVKVKHGYWEEYWDDDYMESFHRCSECKNDAPAKRDTYCDQVLTNYCPICGAKMDLKEGEEV
jgi:hypothetical protein